MIHIQTLCDLDSDQAIYADCLSCNHSIKLNLLRIINTNGDLTFDQLQERLRCQKCGSRDVRMITVWEGNEKSVQMPGM